MEPVRILAVSGSLRAASSNTILLNAAQRLAPDSVAITLFDGLSDLPHFNPDLDGPVAPPAVAVLRAAVQSAEAVLISSPEYAHGVPGVLKNGLDWLVSGVEILCKPIGLLNASPRSTHAQASLTEILTTMSTTLVPGASLAVPLSGRRLDVAGILADPTLVTPLRSALDALAVAVLTRRANPEPAWPTAPS